MKTLIIMLFSIISLTCHGIELGEPIESAAKAYLQNGAEAFIPTLLKGSPIEGDKTALSQSNSIRQIETFYGKFLKIEAMREKVLSENVRLVYYIMNYEHSPVFGNAMLYKKNGKEIVTNFNFNTELFQIAPMPVVFD